MREHKLSSQLVIYIPTKWY